MKYNRRIYSANNGGMPPFGFHCTVGADGNRSVGRVIEENLGIADAVISNGNGIVCIIGYEKIHARAPTLLGYGRDAWGEVILRKAREENVPVLKNGLLVYLLLTRCSVGYGIDVSLYRVMAATLAHVYVPRDKGCEAE